MRLSTSQYFRLRAAALLHVRLLSGTLKRTFFQMSFSSLRLILCQIYRRTLLILKIKLVLVCISANKPHEKSTLNSWPVLPDPSAPAVALRRRPFHRIC